ncbi:hypothetical protein BRADI_4g04000v3 [Brachypodium distachyon]|uniref:Knottin scorpion toxin-like domain-containing protein n=1 Tax=Brachypodium distachyon TaxID=15368 RepID=I1IHA2_BRADI|nr:hypothetical protein BRADI_4g04000v3 [Brachypodium distachyon]
MHGHRPAGVLLCLVLLAVAGAAYASPAANSHAGATALMGRLEDSVAPELMMSTHLLGAGYISGGALDGSSQRCLKDCAAKGRGDPYTGPKPVDRGCNPIYRCSH